MLGELWHYFYNLSVLDQLGLLSSIIAILTLVSGVAGWMIKRIYVGKMADAMSRIEHLDGLLEHAKRENSSLINTTKQLENDIRTGSPIFWAKSLKQRVNNPDSMRQMITSIGDCLENIREPVRDMAHELALHHISVSFIEQENLKKAWYYSSIALCLREGDDIRLLRDSIREIIVDIAEQTKQYEPGNPQWDNFDLIPSDLSLDYAKSLTTKMNNKALTLSQKGEVFTAHRMMTHAMHIQKLSIPDTDDYSLMLRLNYLVTLIGIKQYEIAIKTIKEIIEDAENYNSKSLSPESRNMLQLRHQLAACYRMIKDENSARNEAIGLLPLIEKFLGKEDILYHATLQFLTSNNSNDLERRSVLHTKYGNFEL